MYPLAIVEHFVFSERANEVALNNNVELTIWDRLTQIQQLRDLRQAQYSQTSTQQAHQYFSFFVLVNRRNSMLESSGPKPRKNGKGKKREKESAAVLYQFYGAVTLNSCPVSEGSFNQLYYLERLVWLMVLLLEEWCL